MLKLVKPNLVTDMDDVLIESSPVFQKYLDERTIYTTDELNICEQESSNARFILSMVCEEIEKARIEERDIDFSKFPHPEYFSDDDTYNIFMQRIINNEFALSLVRNELEKAKSEGREIDFSKFPLIPSQANDVVKNIDFARKSADEILRYFNLPVEKSNLDRIKYTHDKITLHSLSIDNYRRSYDYVLAYYEKVLDWCKYSKEMFLESRDTFLEKDNCKSVKEGLIPYHEIYIKKNLSNEAIDYLERLARGDEYGKKPILTAHNGTRENDAKRKLIESFKLEYLGQRFHAAEHIDGIRRSRYPKATHLMEVYNLKTLDGYAIIDDSIQNVKPFMENGGIGLHFKRQTLLERSMPKKVKSTRNNHEEIKPIRITSLDYDKIHEAIENEIENRARQKSLYRK